MGQGRITEIIFEGLDKTKPAFLEQYVTINQGDPVDSMQIEDDRRRLVNLAVLSEVKYRLDDESNGYRLIFECEEYISLLPIVNFGGIKENFWFRLGASESNFFGLGHRLSALYQYYERHTARINYRVPRFIDSNWGMNISVVKWSTIEPLYFEEGTTDYDYDNNSLELLGIYHFDFHNSLELGGSYFREYYTKNALSAEAPGPDEVEKNKLLGKLVVKSDYLNYNFFYVRGWYNVLHAETVKTINENTPFYIFFNDLLYFRRIKARGNWANRLRVGLSTNNDSPFAPFVLDSYVNIRGSGNRIDRGTGSIVYNTEYRHAFLDGNIFAIQGVAFMDMGTWRQPGGEINDFWESENLKIFGGGGVRVIFKKAFNAMLRVDYGISFVKAEKNGFVIGLGQYF